MSGSTDPASLFSPLPAKVLEVPSSFIPKLLLCYSTMELTVVSETLYLKTEKKLGSIAQDVSEFS